MQILPVIFQNIDTENVTSMSNVFEMCTSLLSIDLAHFDTSNVTNMSGMFISCCKVSTLDLSSFDTSKVTNMIYMFYMVDEDPVGILNTIIVGNKWNTSAVTNSSNMFFRLNSLSGAKGTSYSNSNNNDTNTFIFKNTSIECISLSDKFIIKYNNKYYELIVSNQGIICFISQVDY